jgi:hypothetical protein
VARVSFSYKILRHTYCLPTEVQGTWGRAIPPTPQALKMDLADDGTVEGLLGA